jgi:sulfur transfer complex TusBCD TusB component (DsrH family)
MQEQGYTGDLSNVLGLSLPGDVVTLLGDQVTVSMPAKSLSAIASGSASTYSLPDIGARVLTSDPTRAQSVLDRLMRSSSPYSTPPTLNDRVQGNTYLVATSASYLDQIANTSGGLGAQEKFRKVAPGWEKANSLIYLDLAPLSQAMTRQSGEYSTFLGSLTAAGQTTVYGKDSTESLLIVSRS